MTSARASDTIPVFDPEATMHTCTKIRLSAGLVSLSFAWAVLIGIVEMAPLAAQEGRATIQGIVTDPSGGSVPGAAVTVTNTATHVAQTTPTNGVGRYVASNLIVGPYRVSVTKEGFKTYEQSGITIQVDQSAEIDVSLQTGATETL